MSTFLSQMNEMHDRHMGDYSQFDEEGDWQIWMGCAAVASLVVALVVGYFVWRAIKRRKTTTPAIGGTTYAEAILHDRFAKGEVDADEYRSRLATLRSPASQSHAASSVPVVE